MRKAPYRFVLDGVHNRLWQEWGRDPALGARYSELRNGMRLCTRVDTIPAMRRYARAHGWAGAWKADDSFVLVTYQGGRCSTRTFPVARPATDAEIEMALAA